MFFLDGDSDGEGGMVRGKSLRWMNNMMIKFTWIVMEEHKI